MRTAASIRQHRPDPVPDEVIYRVLDNARFAPSGGNRQGWRVIVVRDPGTRAELSEIYRKSWYEYHAPLFTPPGEEPQPDYYADHLDRVPVQLVVVVCLADITTTNQALDSSRIAGGAAIYPFVQNLVLSIRAEGLGTTLTTVLIPVEDEVMQLLHIPGRVPCRCPPWSRMARETSSVPAVAPPGRGLRHHRLLRRAASHRVTIGRASPRMIVNDLCYTKVNVP